MADYKAAKKRARGELGVMRVRIAAAAERARISGKIDGIDEMIDILFKQAKGEVAEAVEMPDGKVAVFRQLPNTNAARILIEHAFGRPKESITIEDPGEKLKGTPQLILVAPDDWKKK